MAVRTVEGLIGRWCSCSSYEFFFSEKKLVSKRKISENLQDFEAISGYNSY